MIKTWLGLHSSNVFEICTTPRSLHYDWLSGSLARSLTHSLIVSPLIGRYKMADDSHVIQGSSPAMRRISIEVHAIKKFMEQMSVYPTFVRMMKSRRKGTVGLGVRINVIAADLKATLETGFWPKNIYAREWLSKERWEKRLTTFNGPPEEQNS